MPRLVRRAPLSERIKAYLDPWDFLLWLSEELNSTEWEDWIKEWSIPLGATVNFIFIVCRANSSGLDRSDDDVFGDYDLRQGSGWFAWLCTSITYSLATIAFSNAYYTFTRTRSYRLFESDIDKAPITPSARRVRVDSQPMSSSPMRFLSNMISSTAESRAHPDPSRDVWEISVWDPTPICLRLFCLFSPGHVLVYWLFLPVAPLDPRPSVTVVTTVILGTLLSAQLYMLQRNFSQQTKDAAIVHKEVLNEYDTKFVHPSLNKPVRDVGIQTPTKQKSPKSTSEVDLYTPTTIVNRGFHTNPNPAYANQYDPDYQQLSVRERLSRAATTGTPPGTTPLANGGMYSTQTTSSAAGPDFSSPIRGPPTHSRSILTSRQPQFKPPTTGDGGSLGAYSSAASPLRKASSANYLRGDERPGRSQVDRVRGSSPTKRMSDTGVGSGFDRRLNALKTGKDRRESGRF